MALVVRSDTFPLVVLTIATEITAADIASMRGAYRDVHARKERFVHLIETRGVGIPSSDMRRALAGLSREFEDDNARHLIATAAVLESRLAAGALSAIRWISGTRRHYFYATTAQDALAYLVDAAAAENVTLPEDAVERARDFDLMYEGAKAAAP